MKKPSLKDILFIALVLLFTTGAAAALFAVSAADQVSYQPGRPTEQRQTDAASKPAEPEETPEIKILKQTDSVYITESGKAFHIDKGCAGKPENVKEVSCGEARRMGKNACKRCLADHIIE